MGVCVAADFGCWFKGNGKFIEFISAEKYVSRMKTSFVLNKGSGACNSSIYTTHFCNRLNGSEVKNDKHKRRRKNYSNYAILSLQKCASEQ